MKKRILSLLLAAAMVFTSGVVVGGVEADAAAKAGDVFSGANTFSIIAKNSEGGSKDASKGISAGDTLSIKFGDLKIQSDGYDHDPVASGNVNVAWLMDDGKGYKVVGEGETYNVSREEIDNLFAAMLWIPGNDDNLKKEEASKFFKKTNAELETGVTSQSATVGSAMVVSGTGFVVKRETLKKEMITFKSASANSDDVNVKVVNDIIFTNTKTANNLDILFDAEADVVKSKDVSSSKETGGTDDSIYWTTGEAATGSVNQDAELATVTRAAANLYVSINAKESDYVSSGSAADQTIKTDYQLAYLDEDPESYVYLDLNYGDKDKKEATVTNWTKVENTNFVVSSFDAGKKKELPKGLTNKDKDGKTLFLQGWSKTADGKNMVKNTTPTLYTSAVYYAVWGDKAVESDAVYRLFNPSTGEHLYTSDANEYNVLGTMGWNQEGIAWYGVSTGQTSEDNDTNRVRRLLNTTTQEHIYVLEDGNEFKTLVARPEWIAEGVVFISARTGDNIYRLFNPKAATSIESHLWTMDTNEKNVLSTQYGWTYEGVDFFGNAQ